MWAGCCCTEAVDLAEEALYPNAKDCKALLWACAEGKEDVVRRLLDATPDAGVSLAKLARDERDLGPLHFACASGSLLLVQIFCEAPHSSELAPSAGPPAVLVAAYQGHLAVVRYLADEHGALEMSGLPHTWPAWDTLLQLSGEAAEVPPCPLVPALGGGDAVAVSALPAGNAAKRLHGLAEVRAWLSARFADRPAGASPPSPIAVAEEPPGGSGPEDPGVPRSSSLSVAQASLRKGAGLLRRSLCSASTVGVPWISKGKRVGPPEPCSAMTSEVSGTMSQTSASLRERRRLKALLVET